MSHLPHCKETSSQHQHRLAQTDCTMVIICICVYILNNNYLQIFDNLRATAVSPSCDCLETDCLPLGDVFNHDIMIQNPQTLVTDTTISARLMGSGFSRGSHSLQIVFLTSYLLQMHLRLLFSYISMAPLAFVANFQNYRETQ